MDHSKTENNISFEINKITSGEWSALLPRFSDASIYQTWEYGDVRWKEKNLEHVVVKKDGNPVAICQVVVKKLPFLSAGIAFIPWGPLWHPDGRPNDINYFRSIITLLKQEYVIRRKLQLRIDPHDIDDGSNELTDFLLSEGFHRTKRPPYTTILMDLSHDLDTIRKEIHHKWRAHLNKAEKQGLVIEEREDPAAFDIFLQLSTQMMDRKNFVPGVDYKDFKCLFERLPSHLNMHLVTCKKDNEIISVIIYTKIGSRAIYILGATGNAGLKANGSNLIHWNIIQRLKDDQCITYDLGGINPETNYGGYEFKNRLSWKNGTTVQHIGEYECYANQFTKITLSIADKIRILLKKRR